MNPEPVAILGGTGPQGRGLALRFALAGAQVTIGSRDRARAEEMAAKLPALVSGADNVTAATSADVVFVAVPWGAHEATLRSLVGDLRGRVVVDLVNPMEFDARGPSMIPVAEGSAAEQAQAILPESTVVAGFHHVSAKLLLDQSQEIETDILVCGDEVNAKERVLALARLIPGVRAVDAGALRLACSLEGMTSVLLSVNRHYKATTGMRLTRLDI